MFHLYCVYSATSQAKTLIAIYLIPTYERQWIGVKAVIILYMIHFSKTT